jgi:TonB-dependent SusC/RagA subfamily outer membrane receptor
MIDPNEIRSVTVLKDAAAATVYGVRASNGVIVIERKQAIAGKARFTFRAATSVTPKEDYSRYHWEKDSRMNVEFNRNNYKTYETNPFVYNTYVALGSDYIFSSFPPVAVISMQKGAKVITAEEAEKQYAAYASYNNATEYGRLFLRNAVTQTYNFNFSGGTQNALYYVSSNYTYNSLTKDKNDNDRLMFSARSNFNFSKKLSLELTTDYQQVHTKAAPIPDLTSLYPYERLQDSAGNPLSTQSKSYLIPYFNSMYMSMGLKDNLYYPVQEMNEVSDKDRSVINRFTANFRYVLGHGFDLTFGGIYENTQSNHRHYATEQSAEVRQTMNRYATTGSNGKLIFNVPAGAFLQTRSGRMTGLTGRAQLNYNNRIAEDHTLNVILGAEVRRSTEEAGSAAYFGYNDQNLLQQPVNMALFSNGFPQEYGWGNPALNQSELFKQTYIDNRFLSGYFNLVYTWRSKYSFTGSIRVDQSNLFGTDPRYRYKPLWSMGAAWNIDKEAFMQDIAWVKGLKLRLATGFNGNVAKNVLPQAIAQIGYNTFVQPNLLALSLYSYANSRLRWEQTQNHNIGIDYQLFRSISGSLDYYERRSTDLLANARIDATRGGTFAMINQASIRNRGIELNLHADWITRRNFNWNTGLVLSRNISKVLEIYNTLTPTSSASSYLTGSNVAYIKGYPVGALFNYRYAGLDSQGVPMIYDINNKAKRAFPYSPVDGGITDVDFGGTSIPAISAGISNRIDIGNFYFYCMINYYGGFKVRVTPPSMADMRPLEGADNYWRQPGDENIPGKLPALGVAALTTSLLGYSDQYLVSGDYFTMGDLTASYNLRSSAWIKKAGFSNFEIRLQGSNLYTIALNRYNYSIAMGSFAKRYITPTYTIALFTNF